ncbi:MAG: HD domain-containing protein [Armatimonadetes bacterium]|nr:HD domain-containing protein [Armatimonadota bacterium]MBS1710680.1 HD domain-containing protein [Armatimonadota bacterium]MBX3108351.1 HD domain-containing protein [Fimbriimonadaceae bacterium]
MIEPNLPAGKRITLRDIKANPKIMAAIDGANELLNSMGYTEHGHRHVGIVSGITKHIMETLGMPEREVELGQIAAYMHDIGNVINRVDHPISGANLAFVFLNEMGMDVRETAPILGAIGNHEELAGTPISVMSAALIVADKSDVHRSRVQNPLMETFDIHDRVNYAVTKSRVEMEKETKTIRLVLEIDTQFASVMEYFEIFLSRMVMCRKASKLFGYNFSLVANGTSLE